MAQFNFDTPVNRWGTNTLKVDVLEERYGSKDLIPLWVADMDFEAPPCVKEAIIKRATHGVFGYTCPDEQYFLSIVNWLTTQHHWAVDKEWISFIPGVVKGIAFALDCFSKEGDKIIIQPPVYHPFRIITELHKREVVYNPLEFDGINYRMNLELLQTQAKDARMLILCNPHNPGGRVWTREELKRVAQICHENNVLVVSDEIHSDLALNNHQHIPFATVSPEASQISITFMAPSKTFNVAGIVSSFCVIPNDAIREKFVNFLQASELNEGHIFAYLVAKTVYQQGSEWLHEVKKYIWNNITFVDQYLKAHMPKIKAVIPQASFLIWLDCRELGMNHPQLVDFFLSKARLALHEGSIFGKEGEGFMRMNIATPKVVLIEALERLKSAYTQQANKE